jgi:hypothetical protein
MSSLDIRPAWQLPLQWPQVAASLPSGDRHVRQTGRLLKAAIVFAMLALTVLDRFGLRLNADFSIPPGMMAMYGLLAVMFLAGAAQLNPRGALAYLAVASVAALSFVVNASFEPRAYVSIASFLLLTVLYAPFAVSLRPGAVAPELWRWTVGLYIAFSVFLALAGIVQFFVQFVFRPEWLFDYTSLIPLPVRASGGWNTAYSTGEWIKSNGFFLREPSIFSVAMAFALLCELSLARRKWVLATLATGLVLTYSGSGLLCLSAALLFPFPRRSMLQLLAVAALAAALFFVLGDALNLSYTLDRVGEINHERSSAYCRFIYPGAIALQQLDSNVWAGVLGNGPGTMLRMGATCDGGHQTTYAKVLFEYGIAGTLAFGVLVLGALNRSAAPVRIRVGVGVTWPLLGGNLLASEVLLFIYILSAMWPEGTAPRAVKPEGVA